MLAALGAVPAGAKVWSAKELVIRVTQARRTRGFWMRASLTSATPDSGKKITRQLRVRGREDGETVQVLYLCTWPASMKGRILLVNRSAEKKIDVSLFTPPDSLKPLAPDRWSESFLESDFTIEDLADDFWDWPAERIEGDTKLLGRDVFAVEFRPPKTTKSSYHAVRAWISPVISLPLLIEKLDASGSVVKRIRVERLTQRYRKYWVGTTVTAETLGRKARSTLTIHRGERDTDIPADDFTLEGFKRLAGQTAPPKEETETPDEPQP
jgi:hypothetical protein